LEKDLRVFGREKLEDFGREVTTSETLWKGVEIWELEILEDSLESNSWTLRF
jgi:hypothetical protein